MSKLVRIETWPVVYPFVGRFKFFQSPPGVPAGRRTVVVRLTADDGTTGWGQAVPSPRWSYETPETVRSTIERYLAPELVGVDLQDAAEIVRRMDRAIAPSFSTGQPIAKAAVDLALWDLRGKAARRSAGDRVHAATGNDAGSPAREITLSWTLNPTSLDEVEPAVAEARRRGYRHFNIKVAPDVRFDAEVCRLVRSAAPEAFLWADANRGYDLDSALAAAPQLAELDIAALEQPLPANCLSGYRRMREQKALPILMDEGIVSCRDFDEFHALGLLDGVAVKVSRMGGLTEACRLVERLRETGSLFYASGLTDPDLSLAASLALFGGGGLTLPAALNGPQFVQGSILREPLRAEGDQIRVPTGPGLGVEVDPEKLAEYCEPKT